MAVGDDYLRDGVEISEYVSCKLGEVEQVAPNNYHRRVGRALGREIFRQPLIGREEDSVVLPAPLEEIFVVGAFHPESAGVLCILASGRESTSERRREILVDEELHAGFAVGR